MNKQSQKQPIGAIIRSRFPDAYFVAGVGWCGPSWQEAEALERTLTMHRMLDEPLDLNLNQHVDCDCMSCRPWTY